MKKYLRYLRNFSWRYIEAPFILYPFKALKPLYDLGLDLHLFSFPYFVAHNLGSFIKLYWLRLLGKKPGIIYYVIESDGRFKYASAISRKSHSPQTVWFSFPKGSAAQEYFYFDDGLPSLLRGSYADSRMIYSEDSNQERRARYLVFCHRLLNLFEKFTGKIDFFLSGSNNDRYVVEMITAAQERGTDWVVCEREGTYTPFSWRAEAECFKKSKSIQAHYIFTANENHKKMFEIARLPSVKNIEVLGELDVDYFFQKDITFDRRSYSRWKKYRKKVMFLTFGTRNYLEPFLFPADFPEVNWSALLADAEDAFFEFAKANPDVLVIYKMGHPQDLNPVIYKKCQDAGLTNVEFLARDFPCEELLLYVDLVAGFLTTAMFEAMFSDKIVILNLFWKIPEILDSDFHLLDLHKTPACLTMTSKQMFQETLQKFAKGDQVFLIDDAIKEARVKTREIAFYGADGHTSERFFKRLLELLIEKRKNEPQSA